MAGPATLRAILAWAMLAAAAQAAAAPAAGAACSAQPLRAAKRLTPCKVLIVGGGPGGLFAAYLLRSLGKDLCIVERNSWWGGKMQATPAPARAPTAGSHASKLPGVGTCGMRVAPPFAQERCLLAELGVKTELAKFDPLFSARGVWHRSVDDFLGAERGGAGRSLYPGVPRQPGYDARAEQLDLELQLLAYALNVDRDDGDDDDDERPSPNPLTGRRVNPHPSTNCAKYKTLADYFKALYGPAAEAFMEDMTSFKGDLHARLDVCAFLEYARADWELGNSNFYPIGGYPPVWQAIVKRLTAAGVRMQASAEVACLSQLTGGGAYRYAATTAGKPARGWKAERLLLNISPPDVAKLRGSIGAQLARHRVPRAMLPMAVVYYNAFYPSRFWEAYATRAPGVLKITSNDVGCLRRSEFLSLHALTSVGLNASRPVYTDDQQCVAEWRKTFKHGGLPAVRKKVHAVLSSMFPHEKIPQPIEDAFYDAPAAWFYLHNGANLTVDDVARWALHPLPHQPNLCLVAEAYSPRFAGWSQGSLLSAMSCVQQQHADLLAPAAKAELRRLQGGCGGTFDSDRPVAPTETAVAPRALPALLPSTRRPGW